MKLEINIINTENHYQFSWNEIKDIAFEIISKTTLVTWGYEIMELKLTILYPLKVSGSEIFQFLINHVSSLID